MFDLPGYTTDRLKAAGVAAHNMGLCTYAEPERFFSYRRATHRGEPDYGRLISAIILAPLGNHCPLPPGCPVATRPRRHPTVA